MFLFFILKKALKKLGKKIILVVDQMIISKNIPNLLLWKKKSCDIKCMGWASCCKNKGVECLPEVF